jgi:hypothetical protein
MHEIALAEHGRVADQVEGLRRIAGTALHRIAEDRVARLERVDDRENTGNSAIAV